MMKLKGLQWKIPKGLYNRVYTLPSWVKVAIFVVAWAIPLAGFWALFLSSAINELDMLSLKIPELEHEIAVLEAKKQQIPQLEKELREMEKILAKALKLLPEKKDIPSILTEISSLGNEAHLEFQSFKPLPEQKKTFYSAIPVDLQMNGPFHNTAGFFDKIAQMARIVHIKEITMGGAKQSAQIWSQRAKAAPDATIGRETAPGKTEAVTETGTIRPGLEGETDEIQRGAGWLINTNCKAVTYRFLSQAEQEAAKKGKGRKKKKR